MCRPPENVSNCSEISLLECLFSCFCADFTTEPTVSNAITEELSLNKKGSKELVEFYHEDVLAILDDDDRVKPSFSDFHLLVSSQRSGCNPKTVETLTTDRCE